MGVGLVGAGSTAVDSGKYGKNTVGEIENMINRTKLERENYQKQAKSAENSKRISELDERLNNLKTRLDKLKEKQDNGECQTCENRKYQDGSDDPGVSFKTAAKVGPEGAAAAVRGHEYEHVYRNQAKAAQEGKEIVYQNVRIKTAICPECGKSYVSGGETTTVTKSKPVEKSDTENAVSADNKNAKSPEKNSGENSLEKRFSVGMYDRELEIGQFLNIVA